MYIICSIDVPGLFQAAVRPPGPPGNEEFTHAQTLKNTANGDHQARQASPQAPRFAPQEFVAKGAG